MYFEKKTWQPLSLMLILTIGIALLWGMLAGWGFSALEHKLWPVNRANERIVITAAGTPLISTRKWIDYYHIETTYRTLDGQPTTLQTGKQQNELHAVYLPAPKDQSKAGYSLLKWHDCIVGFSDHSKPQIGWYLIRDNLSSGYTYLVGFDLKSKQKIGYIGRNGFRSSLPSHQEQFEQDDQNLSRGQGAICTTGEPRYGSNILIREYYPIDYDQEFPEWVLFLVDGDRLQEIDLRTRKIRTLFQSPNLLGVNILMTREGVDKGDKKKMVHRLMLRLTDRIVLIDRDTGAEQEYLLPESIQPLALSAYSLDHEQLLLVSQNYNSVTNGHRQSELVWLSADGQTERQQEVFLAWPRQTMPKLAQAAMVGLVAPIPLGWMVGGGIVAPLVMIQENKVPNYSAGLLKGIAEGWPGLMISTLLALASAGFTLRLHQRYHRPHLGLWCLFVFLLGPAGLMAYWLGHHRAVLETCSACGRTVPRDRDGCAACGETFAAPELIGTEIFA